MDRESLFDSILFHLVHFLLSLINEIEFFYHLLFLFGHFIRSPFIWWFELRLHSILSSNGCICSRFTWWSRWSRWSITCLLFTICIGFRGLLFHCVLTIWYFVKMKYNDSTRTLGSLNGESYEIMMYHFLLVLMIDTFPWSDCESWEKSKRYVFECAYIW